jgi:hypothetical protein
LTLIEETSNGESLLVFQMQQHGKQYGLGYNGWQNQQSTGQDKISRGLHLLAQRVIYWATIVGTNSNLLGKIN